MSNDRTAKQLRRELAIRMGSIKERQEGAVVNHLAIGIDLGTSTSEIAVFRNGKPQVIDDPSERTPIMPSWVAVDHRGNLLVGHEAAGWVDKPGHGVREIKRKMGTSSTVILGDKEFLPQEISSYILHKLRSRAEEALGEKIEDIVLTVPANFPDAARKATRVAAELAGFKEVRLINEPTAAALSFGIDHLDGEEQLVVFDFGGGTLDVSILEMCEGVMDVIASHGDTALGGKNIDEDVQTRFLSKFKAQYKNAKISQRAMNALRSLAEKAKKQLSHQTTFSDVLSSFAAEDGETIDLEAVLTREEFEHIIQPTLQRAREVLQTALNAKKVRPSSIGRVLLVGGSTYIPAVRKMLREVFGRDAEPTVEPDLAVALGASIQAALVKDLISAENGIILTDVCPFGLGIPVVSRVGDQYMLVYEALMPPNTKIPYSVKREYSLLAEDQEAVEVHLLQDHTGKAQLPEHAVDTGIKGTITGIPPALFGTPHPLELEFHYDLDGCARVTAAIPAVNKILTIQFADSDTQMSVAEKATAAQRFSAMTGGVRTDAPAESPAEGNAVLNPSRAGRFEAVATKALELSHEVEGEHKRALMAALKALADAIERRNEHDVELAGDVLVDVLFEIENEL